MYCLEVSLSDLNNYDENLQEAVRKEPSKFIGDFEEALAEVVSDLTLSSFGSTIIPQLLLKSEQIPIYMRELTATDVNKLLHISGIVISAGKSTAKARTVYLKCRSCGHTLQLLCPEPFQGAVIPRQCQNIMGANEGADNVLGGKENCGLDPYVVVAEKSKYIDLSIPKNRKQKLQAWQTSYANAVAAIADLATAVVTVITMDSWILNLDIF